MAGEIVEQPIEEGPPIEAVALKCFDVIDRKTGKVVYSYEYARALDLQGFEFKDFDHIEQVKPEPYIEPAPPMVALTITADERDRLVQALQQAVDILQKAG